MRFVSLRLKDYRNFSDLRVAFSPRLNIFLGDNGQGKTNLLEALHLLTQGDSFRFSDNSTLIRHGAGESLVEGVIERRDLEYKVRTTLLKSRKSFQLNEKKATSPDIRKLFPSVAFSPESLSAIKEGADQRRELIDDFLVTHLPANADLIAEYRRALRARNRLLKEWPDLVDAGAKTRLLAVLESLNPGFLRLAAELTHARLQGLREIAEPFRESFRGIMMNSTVDISVDYVVSGQSARNFTRKMVDDALRQRALELHDAELGSGTSLVGPHKHDITFLYNQKDSRFFCSQGQQRAIILAFKMAQIVYHGRVHGLYPVLMLDDVLSELDSSRRSALISFLHEIKTQVFLTTTDLTLPECFAQDHPSVIRIADGQVLTGAE
ncbi:MAG: DNA replication and repair protein RecF [Bdellovibrionaceae bacterium]|nr:DNA replication and repair protein RecF [Pseudobdellovibrionaceae bacterium]